MTRVEIVTVGVRLLALWVFLAAVSLVAVSVMQAAAHPADFPGAWPVLIVFAVFLIFSVATWKLSPTLAAWLLPKPDAGERAAAWTTADIELVAYRVVGLNLIGWGMAGLAQWIVFALTFRGDEGIGADGAAQLARQIVLLTFGVALYLGRPGLTRLREKFREQRRMDPDPEGDPEEEVQP